MTLVRVTMMIGGTQPKLLLVTDKQLQQYMRAMADHYCYVRIWFHRA